MTFKIEDNIKLIATDMDGTLLDSNKQMPKDFAKWVKTHKNSHVVIASGRQYETLRRDMGSIADDVDYIAENGGVAYVNGKLVHTDFMNREDAILCINMIMKLEHCTPVLCCADCSYSIGATASVQQKIDFYYVNYDNIYDYELVLNEGKIAKIAIFVDDKNADKVFENISIDSPRLEITLSGNDWIDIANTTVSKGIALTKIMEYLDIMPNECMSFGDYLNDLSLIQACKYGIAMHNGHEKVKQAAAYIADSNDDDGVMKVLRSLD